MKPVMRSRKTHVLMPVFAILGLLWLPACATHEPGVKNVVGTYTATVKGAPVEVTDAASSTLEEMELLKLKSKVTAVDGSVSAQTADGTNVSVDIEQAGDGLSSVRVRVGVAGDKKLSMAIIDGIKKELKS